MPVPRLPAPPLLGASCLAAALAHPLPADQSLAAPHPVQLSFLPPLGCWSGPWSIGLCLWKARLAALWGWRLACLQLLSLQPGSLFCHPTALHPHPLLGTFLLPSGRTMNGLPVCLHRSPWGTAHPGGGWLEAPAGIQCPLCSQAGLRKAERSLQL